MRPRALLGLLVTLACEPSVVDAVKEPVPVDRAGSASGGSGDSGGDVGTSGEGGSGAGLPSPLAVSLLHRYTFDGEGEIALDSRGAAHGQVVGTTLGGDGTLPLAGARTGQFLNLPNGLVSGLTDATFESWLTWEGGNAWQRVFDFGSNSAGVEDEQGPSGRSYIFLTTSTTSDTAQPPGPMRLAYSQGGPEDEDLCNASAPLPIDAATHVAVVIDSGAQTMSLYQDGALLAQCPLTRPLSAISDENNWLGHSNFEADVDLSATYDEFRIYDAALTESQIADSFAAGPNAGR
jgi:Concanavalin A-like lectin/glucanases superfamily